eukprot:Phypoly_transcript_04142.p2 GENE.Phypoly_transcript_04142~~Phypoly_transcript_04142.p2  ORF type:complete len:143 (+),score=25.62 Phypoly_transcript_04142:153-581(+)
MNRIVLPVSRLAVCRSVGVRTLTRPITIQQTKVTTTITDADTPIPLGREGITETFVTSEIHKVGVVTQREVVDAEGNVKRETIPPEKWDADLASSSEEIVKAEKHEDHKGPLSMKALQEKTLKKLLEKETKLSTAKPANENQ